MHTVIVPPIGWAPLHLGELWKFRELLFFLTWRDIKVRYKQTALGATWAILQPVLTMVIFSVIFGGLAKLPSEGIPYPIFTLRTATLAVICLCADTELQQQPGGEPEPDQQSIFPAPGDAIFVGAGRGGGFCNRIRGVDGDDGRITG